jgi:hypothetical protein
VSQTGTRGYLAKGAEDIALQPDGKIVAVGEIEDDAVARYRSR